MNHINLRKCMMVATSIAALVIFSNTMPASALQFWRKKDQPSAENKQDANNGQKSGDLLVFHDMMDVFDPFYHSSFWDYHPSTFFDPFAHHYRHHPRHQSLSRLSHHPFSEWFSDDFDLLTPSSSKAGSLMSSYASLFHTDLVEKENEYRLQVDLPGIDTKDLSISLEENKRKGHAIMTITAERKKETTEEQEKLPDQPREAIEGTKECNKEAAETCATRTEKVNDEAAEKKNVDDGKKANKWIKQERLYGKMERQLLLPENVDLNQVKSQYSNGVLTITLPKLPSSPSTPQKRQISIEAL